MLSRFKVQNMAVTMSGKPYELDRYAKTQDDKVEVWHSVNMDLWDLSGKLQVSRTRDWRSRCASSSVVDSKVVGRHPRHTAWKDWVHERQLDLRREAGSWWV